MAPVNIGQCRGFKAWDLVGHFEKKNRLISFPRLQGVALDRDISLEDLNAILN